MHGCFWGSCFPHLYQELVFSFIKCVHLCGFKYYMSTNNVLIIAVEDFKVTYSLDRYVTLSPYVTSIWHIILVLTLPTALENTGEPVRFQSSPVPAPLGAYNYLRSWSQTGAPNPAVYCCWGTQDDKQHKEPCCEPAWVQKSHANSQ